MIAKDRVYFTHPKLSRRLIRVRYSKPELCMARIALHKNLSVNESCEMILSKGEEIECCGKIPGIRKYSSKLGEM